MAEPTERHSLPASYFPRVLKVACSFCKAKKGEHCRRLAENYEGQTWIQVNYLHRSRFRKVYPSSVQGRNQQ